MFPSALPQAIPIAPSPQSPAAVPQAILVASPPAPESVPATAGGTLIEQVPPGRDRPPGLAEEHRLGNLEGCYRSRFGRWIGVVIGFTFLVILGLASGMGRVSRQLPKSRGYDTKGADSGFESFIWVVLGFAAVAIVAGVVFEVLAWKRRRQVFLYENGLVSVSEGKGEACRWEEVAEIRDSRHDVGWSRSRSYLLALADGRYLDLTDLNHLQRLAGTVGRKTVGRLEQRAMAENRAGGAADGVVEGSKPMPSWDNKIERLLERLRKPMAWIFWLTLLGMILAFIIGILAGSPQR